jgi:hypothetical protein
VIVDNEHDLTQDPEHFTDEDLWLTRKILGILAGATFIFWGLVIFGIWQCHAYIPGLR